MAKLSIEYGKIKKDGSRSVMIRLVSGRTQKHIPTYVNLEKRDYKEYPEGRIVEHLNPIHAVTSFFTAVMMTMRFL